MANTYLEDVVKAIRDGLFCKDKSNNMTTGSLAMSHYFNFEGAGLPEGYRTKNGGNITEIISKNKGYVFFKCIHTSAEFQTPQKMVEFMRKYSKAGGEITKTFIDYENGLYGFSWRKKK